MLSVNLYAKERRGAKLSVWKIGDQKIKGELIAVKEDSLLLLESESGADVSVNIKDIAEIRTVNKASVTTGAVFGILIGGVIGVFWPIGTSVASDGEESGIMAGILIGSGVALISVLIGHMAGSKRYVFSVMTDQEIQEALDYLRKKARVRDYK